MAEAEIERQHTFHVDPQLLIQRQVQAELMPQLRHELRIGRRPIAPPSPLAGSPGAAWISRKLPMTMAMMTSTDLTIRLNRNRQRL